MARRSQFEMRGGQCGNGASSRVGLCLELNSRSGGSAYKRLQTDDIDVVNVCEALNRSCRDLRISVSSHGTFLLHLSQLNQGCPRQHLVAVQYI